MACLVCMVCAKCVMYIDLCVCSFPCVYLCVDYSCVSGVYSSGCKYTVLCVYVSHGMYMVSVV